MSKMTATEYHSARKRLGLTQARLAAALGVMQSTVSDRETGRREITREAELAIKSLQPTTNPAGIKGTTP